MDENMDFSTFQNDMVRHKSIWRVGANIKILLSNYVLLSTLLLKVQIGGFKSEY